MASKGIVAEGCVAEAIRDWYTGTSLGQVAQLVERSPEKAGVGGSIPSLATTKKSITLASFDR